MSKPILLSNFLLFISYSLFAQDSLQPRMIYSEHSFSVLTGLKYYGVIAPEVGISYRNDMRNAPHPSTLVFYASTEMFYYDHKPYIAPKIGAWAGGGMAGLMIGANLAWYTNFDSSSLRWQPEIGMGFSIFRFYYARNIPVNEKKDFKGINRNMFGVNVLIDFKRKQTFPYQQTGK